MVDVLLKERYALAEERIREIPEENSVQEPYRSYFAAVSTFLQPVIRVMDDPAEIEKDPVGLNECLYKDILPEQYENSYGNPAYAVRMLGEYGRDLCFLYAEVRGAIVYAFENRLWDLTVTLELLLEVYSAFCDESLPTPAAVHEILKSYVEDYAEDMVGNRVRECMDPAQDFALSILMESDLTDPSYLYRYGEYISENELGTARLLNAFSQEEIDAIASTYTEGYRKGFLAGHKDIAKKKTVNIRYNLGFERVIRAAVRNFRSIGLEPVMYRHATHLIDRRNQTRIGYTGGIANPQYDYDHRQDLGLFLDQELAGKKKRALRNGYEAVKDLAAGYGGPAAFEMFGEKQFVPVIRPEAVTLTEAQQKILIGMDNDSAEIRDRYVPEDETSFTIIAFPCPEIGEPYEEIFREIMRINALDSDYYSRIQQKIIDVLDTCEWVEVKGRDGNETDLLIHLHTLTDPQKQTNFENCVADVNIPVGEVFTSPVLAGTGGVLHVKSVYLRGLLFKDLRLVFDCGQVIDYSCGNFESEEENRRYIEDNILFHHPKIPMGEFAIGTNTTAHVVSHRYGIADKLPILIAEKTGPHFAVGDTCYSREEDSPVYNPDGKEVIARDNEISILRKEDPGLAYYGCHTDITIPYEELGGIRVIDDEGEMVPIIENGRFVLPGTEELNSPFDTAGGKEGSR